MASAALITKPTFTLADRLKVQQQAIRDRSYLVIGRLTAVLFEAQRDTRGLSQSRARYANNAQPHLVSESMKPFSEKQTILFQSTTIDWLNPKNGPILARSRDGKDLLLPQGMTSLPDIPDPRWVPGHAMSLCPKGSKVGCSRCIAPRIPQLLTGCPVVGDRVRDKITSREGRVFGILHPVVTLSVAVLGRDGFGSFANIRCGVDQADGTHMALLLDDENHGFFVGGTFS